MKTIRLKSLILGLIIGVGATFGAQYLLFEAPFPVATLPDGAVYQGDLINGQFSGRGTMIWPNGARYQGEFLNGMFHGKGEFTETGFHYDGDFQVGEMTGSATIIWLNDERYVGEVKAGLMHGKGEYYSEGATYIGEFESNYFHGSGELTEASLSTYSGQFRNGKFHGTGLFQFNDGSLYSGEFVENRLVSGTHTSLNGDIYEGQFQDWVYDGEGQLTTTGGDSYSGQFSFGYLQGPGEHFAADGSHYVGEFDYGRYHGQGKLISQNGDIYEGEFFYGDQQGQGKITYANPVADVIDRSGTWESGQLITAADGTPIVSSSHLNEMALYNQIELLQKNAASIQENDPDNIDLYFLGISGDGTQAVFRREIEFVQAQFEARFHTRGKSSVLINSRETIDQHPLATQTSIQRTLNHLSEKMDKAEDILFIYMTSHGSNTAEFQLKQSRLDLPDLSANKLAEFIKSTAIKWKVIVISACYSGQFIEPLKDEHTLIITAAAEDRTSFGCSDDADFTYFGDAYFNQALQQTTDFVAAFDLAVSLVQAREAASKFEPSLPQIYKTEAIEGQLDKWRRQQNISTGSK
jgi:hypothetical protein